MKKQLWICEYEGKFGQSLEPIAKFPFTMKELEFLKESFEDTLCDDYFYNILFNEFKYPITASLLNMDKKDREEAQRRTNLLEKKLQKLIEELKTGD